MFGKNTARFDNIVCAPLSVMYKYSIYILFEAHKYMISCMMPYVTVLRCCSITCQILNAVFRRNGGSKYVLVLFRT
jgi:hypothetical protein